MRPESIGTISITPEEGTFMSPGTKANGDCDFAVSNETNTITSMMINPAVSIGLSRSFKKIFAWYKYENWFLPWF